MRLSGPDTKNLLVKTKEEQKPIDDTVIAKYIAPHNRNRHAAADDGREIKERPVNAHTLFGSVQNHRDEKRKREAQRHTGEHVIKRNFQRTPVFFIIGQHRLIVVKADPFGRGEQIVACKDRNSEAPIGMTVKHKNPIINGEIKA